MLDITTLQKFDLSKIGLTILAIFFLSFSGFSQSCDGELSVHKNRNTRSADEDGALFSLEFKNLSGVSDSFELEYIFLEQPCANKNRASKRPNVPVNIQFRQNGAVNDDPIVLAAGGSKSFEVLATVPDKTQYNSWSCVQIQVKSTKCGSVVDSQVLKVYITDPSEN